MKVVLRKYGGLFSIVQVGKDLFFTKNSFSFKSKINEKRYKCTKYFTESV